MPVARSIRKAEPTDAQTILHLQRLAYQSEAKLYPGEVIAPLTQSLAELEQEFLDHTFYVAEDAEFANKANCAKHSLLGSVKTRIEGETLYLGRFIVDPVCQGMGVGSALLAHVEAQADGRVVELFTGARSTENIRFYIERGYRNFKAVELSAELTLLYFMKQT